MKHSQVQACPPCHGMRSNRGPPSTCVCGSSESLGSVISNLISAIIVAMLVVYKFKLLRKVPGLGPGCQAGDDPRGRHCTSCEMVRCYAQALSKASCLVLGAGRSGVCDFRWESSKNVFWLIRQQARYLGRDSVSRTSYSFIFFSIPASLYLSVNLFGRWMLWLLRTL